MLCPVCRQQTLAVFYDAGRVPVLCNRLWPTSQEAREAARGDLRLGFCSGCAYIGNVAFDPGLITYTTDYENSLHFSPTFQRYAERLANELVASHDLRERLIVEIGCGKGEFLALICDAGHNRGLGIDSSYEGPPTMVTGSGAEIRFIREPLTRGDGGRVGDAVLCRHVLEHIPTPREFLAWMIESGKPGGLAFVETPDALWTLRDLGIWDLIYEHCSYFARPAMMRLLQESGLRVVRCEPTYGGQFLVAEAFIDAGAGLAPDAGEIAEVGRLVSAFAEACVSTRRRWNEKLQAYLAAGEQIAIWGAGSKGVTFLNSLAQGDAVRWVVDINPRKAGGHVPGGGQQVVTPESLGRDVSRVLVLNPLYEAEIRARLQSMGLNAIVETV